MKGLFKGNFVHLLKSAPEKALKFGFYEQTKKKMMMTSQNKEHLSNQEIFWLRLLPNSISVKKKNFFEIFTIQFFCWKNFILGSHFAPSKKNFLLTKFYTKKINEKYYTLKIINKKFKWKNYFHTKLIKKTSMKYFLNYKKKLIYKIIKKILYIKKIIKIFHKKKN